MAIRADAVVIGAGVVGLATARALAKRGREVLVLEAQGRIGSITSSRNSEVVHAGIYYPTGSLKAKACVAGRRMLQAYCHDRNVPFHQLGKLIVATTKAELRGMARLQRQAVLNGLTSPQEALRYLQPEEARKLEPEVSCVAALLSPSTSIVDSHMLMLALQADIEANGGSIAFHSFVTGGHIAADKASSSESHIRLNVLVEDEVHSSVNLPSTQQNGSYIQQRHSSTIEVDVECKILINCAGLAAPSLAASIDGIPSESIPAHFFAKGNYFALMCQSPFSHLVYPLPQPGGLGVHATIDFSGRCRFGPDVQWVQSVEGGPNAPLDCDRFDYDVDPARAETFYAAVRRYWPALPEGALVPDYAGIRPKLGRPENPSMDFVFSGPPHHGVGGLINMFGIESPGLTSCLYLGECAAQMSLGCS